MLFSGHGAGLVPVCTPVYYHKDTKCVATVIFETVWSLEIIYTLFPHATEYRLTNDWFSVLSVFFYCITSLSFYCSYHYQLFRDVSVAELKCD